MQTYTQKLLSDFAKKFITGAQSFCSAKLKGGCELVMKTDADILGAWGNAAVTAGRGTIAWHKSSTQSLDEPIQVNWNLHVCRTVPAISTVTGNNVDLLCLVLTVLTIPVTCT